MKKMLCLLLAFVLALAALGCNANKTEVAKNDLFTDAFFQDVVGIRDSAIGVVTGDGMLPVIQYLQGLSLTETEEFRLSTKDENGEQLFGLDGITFDMRDGTEVAFLHNHAALTDFSDGRTYVVDKDGENLKAGLSAAFAQATNP